MKLILYLIINLFFCCNIFAIKEAFLVKKDGYILKKEGNCAQRYSPCSTFKIPLALIAYNENILIDELRPELPYNDEYQETREICKQSCNPLKWIQNSFIWYSQEITQKLGMNKIENYLKQFNYGNQDFSGDKGQNNGLKCAWLSSSLKISVEEQINFLERFLNFEFKITPEAYKRTHDILFIEDFLKSFKLYGKTGAGCQLNPDRSFNENLQFGWFIGWLEKDDIKIIFAYYLENEIEENVFAGIMAKERAKNQLLKFI